MKLIHFLLLGYLLAGCSYFEQSAKKSDKSIAIRQVLNKTIDELYIQEKLYLAGRGIAAMDEVKQLDLFFEIDRKMNLEEARKLFLKAHRLFLKNINESESLRPYLKQYPFPEKDVKILISYIGSEPCVNKQAISYVSNRWTNIYYQVDEPGKLGSLTIHEESLDEANRIFSENIPQK